MYEVYTSYLEKSPSKNINDTMAIRDWAIRNIPLASAKRFIAHLAAVCEGGIVNQNPFRGMSAQIKLPKAGKNDDGDVYPFTRSARDQIVAKQVGFNFVTWPDNRKGLVNELQSERRQKIKAASLS